MLLFDISLLGWNLLQQEAKTYTKARYSKSSKVTRSRQIAAYLDFCSAFPEYLSPYPCSPHQVCLYISFLARKLKFTSIRNYLSGLNDHLLSLNLKGIDYTNYEFKSCMSGIRLTLGVGSRQAEPLLPANLLAMFLNMFDTLGHTAVRAAMLLSFRGLLRKSHVTNSAFALRRRDFTFSSWGMSIEIIRSKTIAYGQPSLCLPIVKLENSRLCAVHWTKTHFHQCPAPDDAQAFRMPKNGNSVPLEYDFYLKVIKMLCLKAGLDPKLFSSHSLRRGGATYLSMVGLPIDQIKARGNWASNAVYLYIKKPFSSKLSQDRKVAKFLNKF